MPTNYQAQVKKMPKSEPSRLKRESVSAVPSLNPDAVVRRSFTGRKIGPPRLVTTLPDPGLLRVTRTGLSYRLFKRLIDLVLGSVLFLAALPIVLIAALAIRVNTPGSPFFFQTRLGKNGRPFKIFKLRGMYIDARSRFPSYYDYSSRQDLEFCFHHEEDPRVTPAGRFIRRTSIDELPNLWNVVRGDMSLVGPRPEIPEVFALYGRFRDEYLSVKPGVTCLSKITGRDKLTKQETIDFDIGYIRTRSFALDVRILWKTFCNVVLRRDVF